MRSNMFLISHRGNIDGANSKNENSENYIYDALRLGYDCEVDVWYAQGEFFLGHDAPDYITSESFLKQDGLWLHAKTIDTLIKLQEIGAHCFFIEDDFATLTSKGFIWQSPTSLKLCKNTICVMPEDQRWNSNANLKLELSNAIGICSDFISSYKI